MRSWRRYLPSAILSFASMASAQDAPFTGQATVRLQALNAPKGGGTLRVAVSVDLGGVSGMGPGGATAAALGASVIPVQFDKKVLLFVRSAPGTSAGYTGAPKATVPVTASALGEVTLAASAGGDERPTGVVSVGELQFHVLQPGVTTRLQVISQGNRPLSVSSAYLPTGATAGPALVPVQPGPPVNVTFPAGFELSAPQPELTALLLAASCLLIFLSRKGRRGAGRLAFGLMSAWLMSDLMFGGLARAAAPLLGDLDDDGTTGTPDLRLLQDYLVGNAGAVANAQTGRGDLDGSGMIDAVDLALMRAALDQGVELRPGVELIASPSPATAGQAVTLSWTSTRAASAQITGISGPLPASGTRQVTPASLPAAYTITATGAGGTAQATASVGKQSTFTLSAVPASVEIPRNSFAYHVLKLASADGFTGMADLSAEGLPAGVTATFTPPRIAPGSAADMTLSVSGSAAVTTSGFTVRAAGSSAGVTLNKTASLSVKVLGAGTYSSGRVVTADAVPVPIVGAVVSFVQNPSIQAVTDAAGNYLFKTPLTGQRVIKIDTRNATAPAGSTFTFVQKMIEVAANQPNPMPMAFFMPRINVDDGLDLPANGCVTQDTLFLSTAVPGLEVLFRAGTCVTDYDSGDPVTRISETRLDVDRFPGFLMTDDADSIYTLQPEGALVTIPVEVTYPNISHTPPGTELELYALNIAAGQFAEYGDGTVSADGTRVVPDPDPARPGYRYGLTQFSWHFPPDPPDPGGPPTHSGGPSDGDPVDLSTGAFVQVTQDLAARSLLGQAAVQRTYRTLTDEVGAWGLGWSANFDTQVFPSGTFENPQELVLRLPGGETRVFGSAGGGVFGCKTDPSCLGDQITGSLLFGPIEVHFQDGDVWGFQGFNGPPRGQGRLVYQRDRNNNTTTITRDTNGRAIRITEPGGRSITLAWNPQGSLSSATDLLGREVVYAYDAQGRLVTVTEPTSDVWTYTWDAQGNVKTFTNPRGALLFENTYDAGGRVSLQKIATGVNWTFTYALSIPSMQSSKVVGTTVSDPLGHKVSYRFNSAGFLLETVDELGRRTVQQRHPTLNVVTSLTDPLGRTQTFDYDQARGLLTGTTDPANGHGSFEYHPTFNWLTKYTDPLGHTLSVNHDARGNRTRVTDSRGQAWNATYDQRGLLQSVRDPLGHTSLLTYSARGDLLQVADPLGHTVRFQYDLAGRLIKRIDPLQQIQVYEYDGKSRLTARVSPLGLREEFTYDAAGNLTSFRDGAGHQWSLGYDQRERLETWTDLLGAVESYTYDADDQLVTRVDREGQTTNYTYAANGQLLQAAYGDGSSASYRYDTAGRVIRAEDSSTGAVDLQYDLLDNLTAEASAQGTVHSTYDAAGRRTSRTVNTSTPETYGYDAGGLPTSVSSGTLAFTFTYDGQRRLTSVTRPGGVSSTYTYDNADRLLQIEHKKGVTSLSKITYTYDAAGHRTAIQSALDPLPPDDWQATVDAANRLNTANGRTVLHDRNGNLVALGDLRYAYDARQRLAQVSGPGMTASFAYDAFGRRISRNVAGNSTTFLNDGANLAQETTGGLRSQLLAGLGLDDWLARSSAAGSTILLPDALGSTVAETDASGALGATYTYTPSGQTQAQGSAAQNSLRFNGREQDAADLYWYRNRYYQPELGRFLTEDPLRLASGSLNFYTYVHNDPLNRRDPLGLADINISYPEHNPTYRAPSDPGTNSVDAHGDANGPLEPNPYYSDAPDNFYPRYRVIPPDELADRIIDNPNYKPGKPVKLYVCNTGNGDYPQKLADALKQKTGKSETVLAPNSTVKPQIPSLMNGHQPVEFGPDPQGNPGKFTPFKSN